VVGAWKPKVQQALGEVHRRDAELLGLALQRDDELVAGAPLGVGQLEAGSRSRAIR
jgi:hypothetical protein